VPRPPRSLQTASSADRNRTVIHSNLHGSQSLEHSQTQRQLATEDNYSVKNGLSVPCFPEQWPQASFTSRSHSLQDPQPSFVQAGSWPEHSEIALDGSWTHLIAFDDTFSGSVPLGSFDVPQCSDFYDPCTFASSLKDSFNQPQPNDSLGALPILKGVGTEDHSSDDTFHGRFSVNRNIYIHLIQYRRFSTTNIHLS
jgi:hypothetical protein